MAKMKIISLMVVIAIQAQLWDGFPVPTWLPIQPIHVLW